MSLFNELLISGDELHGICPPFDLHAHTSIVCPSLCKNRNKNVLVIISIVL